MFWMFLALSCVFGASLAQTDLDLSSLPVSIPPELQQKLNSSEVEKYQKKYSEEFKKKCEQNGHPEVFENSENMIKTFMSCYESVVNMTQLQQEIEDAKPNGEVDEVFKKYCHKSPEIKACFRNVTETVRPCFSQDEQKNFKTLYNVTDQLIEFVCYKDGDRIALFIAEGGRECFQDKQEDVQECVSKVYDSETQDQVKNITTFEGIMQLEFKEKQCDQMTQLQSCVVGVLEKCAKPTSANIVESLFNFIRKATPCKSVKATVVPTKNQETPRQKTPTGGANAVAVTTATIFTALSAAMLL